MFEIFDDRERRLGLVPRDEAHRAGHWHRAVHVWVFDTAGRLLLQQRAAHKDLYPGAWDCSVGEHLLPGEAWTAGARRGLREELGVDATSLSALGDVIRVELAGPGYVDRELQRSFQTIQDDGFVPDAAEVAAVKFVSLPELSAWTRAEPGAFAPAFISQARRYGFLPESAAS